jgi:hypothetical protein
MTTTVAEDEARAFADSVEGALGKLWPNPRSAGEQVDPAALWDLAVSQGWTSLGGADAFEALVAAQAVLGRAASPLPLLDAFVATRLLAGHPDLCTEIEAGRIRAAVVPEARPTAAWPGSWNAASGRPTSSCSQRAPSGSTPSCPPPRHPVWPPLRGRL